MFYNCNILCEEESVIGEKTVWQPGKIELDRIGFYLKSKHGTEVRISGCTIFIDTPFEKFDEFMDDYTEDRELFQDIICQQSTDN
jgi:hypothetical protein